MNKPRITFGVIVLNGQPFTKYCLRSIYPFAHEIIVAEGASPHAKHLASDAGHSVDGTLEELKRFRSEEDPENKITIITAEDCGHPDGFWPGEKDEQCTAWTSRATGDWIWQIDIDEFYKPEDMQRVIDMLDEKITAVSFNTLTFWGNKNTLVNGIQLMAGGKQFRRLFRFGEGYSYSNHRPPTVLDPGGNNLYDQNPISGESLERAGIMMHHYALLFPHQVRDKCGYYRNLTGGKREDGSWFEESYLKIGSPFHVHNIPEHFSWLEKYSGTHPLEAARMLEELKGIETRPTEDIDKLLNSTSYKIFRTILKCGAIILRKPLNFWMNKPAWMSKTWLKKLFGQ